MIINCFLAIILGVQKNKQKSRRMNHFCLICFSSRCLHDCGSFFSIFFVWHPVLWLFIFNGKQTNNKFRGNMFLNVSQTNFHKVYMRNCKIIYKISKWRSKISKTFDRSKFLNTRKKDPCCPERMETFSVYYLTK